MPPLSSYSDNPLTLLLEDAIDDIIGALLPQWGIFLDGFPVLTYDNQTAFAYSQDYKIATYPIEEGSFQSYDKVQEPAEIRCRFSAGASAINRQAMLQSVDAVMSTTDLYDVVTPEEVFLGYNFSHRDYDRAAANVGLVVIDVWLVEILESATAQFQSTQSPAYAGQTGLGTVTATPTTGATQGAITGWQ